MNILVLGNGFDLAHGLPTKYTDFLKFVEVVKQIEESRDDEKIDWKDIDLQIKAIIINKKIENGNLYIDELSDLLKENVWIDYFLQNPMYQKENWIDFESEIGRVIEEINTYMIEKEYVEGDEVKYIPEQFFNDYFIEDLQRKEEMIFEAGYSEIQGKQMTVTQEEQHMKKYMEEHPVESEKDCITYKQLIDRLKTDLERLIRSLEIYLAEFIENIECEKISPDIKKILENVKKDNPFEDEEGLKIINFNYTNTFERIYGVVDNIEYDYIHGKANIKNTINIDNMVLGIDEYFCDDKKNTNIEFVSFKKYYQRILKHTGCEYKKWVYDIKDDWNKMTDLVKQEVMKVLSRNDLESWDEEIHKLYIFGHSLDDTDGDILRELILNDNVYTTIYYHEENKHGNKDNGKKDLETKISKLLKVITQDELIKRTGGSTKTIEFKLQADMVEKETIKAGE